MAKAIAILRKVGEILFATHMAGIYNIIAAKKYLRRLRIIRMVGTKVAGSGVLGSSILNISVFAIYPPLKEGERSMRVQRADQVASCANLLLQVPAVYSAQQLS